MRLSSLLVLSAAAAGAFAGARALLERDEAPQGLPGPMQKPVTSAHARLHRMRDLAAEALRASREERDEAERELRAEYLTRTGRAASSISSETARLP